MPRRLLRRSDVELDLRHFGRLRSLLSLDDLEFHRVALSQGVESAALNGAVVHEYVRPTFVGDEAKTLRVVEPLYGAGDASHGIVLPNEGAICGAAPAQFTVTLLPQRRRQHTVRSVRNRGSGGSPESVAAPGSRSEYVRSCRNTKDN